MCAVHRDLVHVRVEHSDVVHHRHRHPLTCFDGRARGLIECIPCLAIPKALGDVTISFRQSVDLSDMKAHGFNRR